MKKLSRILFLLAGISIAQHSLAFDACWNVRDYLSVNAVDFTRLLPPPPAADSDLARRDFAELMDIFQHSTPEQRRGAQADEVMDLFVMKDVLGAHFNARDLPKTEKLLQRLYCNERQWSHAAKEHYRRNRPFQDHKELKAMLKADGYSYPSGHSTFIYSQAIVLANLLPSQAEPIYRRAERYAYNRAVAGVHYPSDIQAGRALSMAIDAVLMQQEDFRKDFDAAREELQHAPLH